MVLQAQQVLMVLSGETGAQGATGTQGNTGSQGATGAQGATGGQHEKWFGDQDWVEVSELVGQYGTFQGLKAKTDKKEEKLKAKRGKGKTSNEQQVPKASEAAGAGFQSGQEGAADEQQTPTAGKAAVAGEGGKSTLSAAAHTYSGRIESRVSTNHGAWLNKPSWQKSWKAEERNLRKCTEEVFETERKKQEQGKQRRRRSAKPRTLQRLPDVRTKPSTGHGRGNRYGGAKAQLIEVTEIHV